MEGACEIHKITVRISQKYIMTNNINKFGICEWCLATSGPSALKTAAMIGFDGVQIGDLGGAGKGFPLLDMRIQSQYLEIAAQSNITIHSLHTHALTREGGMRYPLSSQKGEEAIDSFEKAVKVCVQMNIPTVMVASFDASNVKNDYDMKNTAEMLKLFDKIAFEKGILLTYEGVTSIDRVLWMIDYVGGTMKLCYDILNPVRFGSGNPCAELLKLDIGLIDHIHLKDAPYDMEGCCSLGEGGGHFSKTVRMIVQRGYKGWVLSENYYYLPPMNRIDTGTQLAQRDLTVMKKYFCG
ncbi:MAG: sugar phosphate isomerase/epimerase [Eubacteriales bacterium]|nr:sugar phosphate isomerase/epimerase [Eubacteriales bacterium]